MDTIELRNILTQILSNEDLHNVCFDLRIDYDDILGGTRKSKIRALIAQMEYDGRLPDLLTVVGEHKPQFKDQLFTHADTDTTPPYQGLASFGVKDAGRFFGRERVTEELVAHLQTNRFLAVVGASGSGKSSVVKAGVVPALMTGAVTYQGQNSADWLFHILTPTDQPLKNLAAHLTHDSESVTATTTLLQDMLADTASLDIWLHKQLADQPNQRLLLVVDQFEELFTQCDDIDKRRLFIDNLITAVTAGKQGRLSLIITLRADFYGPATTYQTLRPLLETKQKIIGLMRPDELRQAIEKPLTPTPYSLQAGLVDTILQDINDEPGALPLLSHALLSTWQKRENNQLTLNGYQKIGGVRRAIATTANQVFEKLTDDEQKIAHRLFLELTELGEGTEDTRRRINRDLAHLGDQKAIDSVINTLVQGRLITTDEDSLEVAHEALIREWGLLHTWLTEERDNLRQQREIEQAAKDWQANQYDKAFLYRGGRLSAVEEWYKNNESLLTNTAKNFINQAIKERKVSQQKTLAGIGIGVLLLLIVIILLFQSNLNQQNSLATAQAEGTRADNALATAELALDDANNQRATAEAEATRADNALATATVALADSIKQSRLTLAQSLLNKSQAIASTPLISQDELTQARLLALEAQRLNIAEGGDLLLGNNWLRQLTTNWTTSYHPRPTNQHSASINSVSWSPDGSQLASASWDNSVIIWDADSGDHALTLSGHWDSVYSVSWSPDGTQLASASADNSVIIWDADSGDHALTLSGHSADVNSVSWSPDGTQLASASRDNSVIIWDADSGDHTLTLSGHSDFVYSVSWSPDGTQLASA
ncbi:MAG TPA: hypothetical protein VLL52_18755, partial [Anaerolineae bacterium]|nr:hypothetical protein [Anaerolineae bacterium]